MEVTILYEQMNPVSLNYLNSQISRIINNTCLHILKYTIESIHYNHIKYFIYNIVLRVCLNYKQLWTQREWISHCRNTNRGESYFHKVTARSRLIKKVQHETPYDYIFCTYDRMILECRSRHRLTIDLHILSSKFSQFCPDSQKHLTF